MKKLVIILLASLAICTFIRAIPSAEARENMQEKPVEIVQ